MKILKTLRKLGSALMRNNGKCKMEREINKITHCVSRFGSAMPSNQIILEAELSQEFSNIVDIYRNQTINNRIQIGLCIFLIMTATLSSKLGFSSMLVTLLFVPAMLVYLTISQQSMVQSMQRNLYQICYKSLASSLGNTLPQAAWLVSQTAKD